jgi:hypothetical protein
VYTRRQQQQQVQGEQTDTVGDSSSGVQPELDRPIALRKGIRAARIKTVQRHRFEHDISNYVSYNALSPSYKAFVASLQVLLIPRDWKTTKQNPWWGEAMVEELEALRKNKTWELTHLLVGTVKQNLEGKVERYKARLVARGYSQTYGIDYDIFFAPVANMNTVRILISCAANFGWKLHQLDVKNALILCAANFGWKLHQLDVKNAFLHGDLQEEVYMELPPGFGIPETAGKVCRLKKSLYGLEQSPRAWFDRFGQCNGDHTIFYKHTKQKITILAVYVDDIIITGDDEEETMKLKESLRKEFEVKDLGRLKYFLGIEIAKSSKGISLSQRKYTLDLLNDMGMTGCRAAPTPIDQNHKLTAQSGELVDKESY